MFSIEIVTQNASINEVQERKEKKKKRNTWNWIIYSINDNKQLNSIKKKKKKLNSKKKKKKKKRQNGIGDTLNETTTGAFRASRDARKSAETRRTCAYIMSLIVSLREKEKSPDENYEVVEGATRSERGLTALRALPSDLWIVLVVREWIAFIAAFHGNSIFGTEMGSLRCEPLDIYSK